MKLWHDDVRPAPPGWVWAQDNDAAKEYLKLGVVTEISMDHDLGADPRAGLYARGWSYDTGEELVKWMIEEGRVPEKVRIHSWNPSGARRMALRFIDAGYPAPEVRPFEVSEMNARFDTTV